MSSDPVRAATSGPTPCAAPVCAERSADRRERLVPAERLPARVLRDQAIVVGRPRLEVLDRRGHQARARAGAGARRRRLRSVTRRRAVLEPTGGREPVRRDGSSESRRRRRHGRSVGRHDRGGGARRERGVLAGRRAGVARGDDAEMVDAAGLKARDPGRLGLRTGSRACALRRGLRAVARRRSVLEVEGGGAAVRVDGPVQRRRRRGDARGGAGRDVGRHRRGEDRIGAVARACAVRRDDAIVVGRAGMEPRQGRRDVNRCRAGAGALRSALRSVRRRRPVLDDPRRRLPARIDGAGHGRCGRSDRGRRPGRCARRCGERRSRKHREGEHGRTCGRKTLPTVQLASTSPAPSRFPISDDLSAVVGVLRARCKRRVNRERAGRCQRTTKLLPPSSRP